MQAWYRADFSSALERTSGITLKMLLDISNASLNLFITKGMKWVFHDSARGYIRGEVCPDRSRTSSVCSEICVYGIVTSFKGYPPNKGDELPGLTRSDYSVWLYHPGSFVWATHVKRSLSRRIIVVENFYCKRWVRVSITFSTCRNASLTLRLFFIAFDSANSAKESARVLLLFEKESLLAGHTPWLKLRCPLPPTSRQLWFLDICHRGPAQGLLTDNKHSVQASDMWWLFVGMPRI